jgi:hypothetical protein
MEHCVSVEVTEGYDLFCCVEGSKHSSIPEVVTCKNCSYCIYNIRVACATVVVVGYVFCLQQNTS